MLCVAEDFDSLQGSSLNPSKLRALQSLGYLSTTTSFLMSGSNLLYSVFQF